ncbi:hypothetical protein C8Q74DRAFT_1222714 [Fomes fomentarius]|nr:hypothetical protein C8Q74DRAFT_1222714 [Fomes fomentarius]
MTTILPLSCRTPSKMGAHTPSEVGMPVTPSPRQAQSNFMVSVSMEIWVDSVKIERMGKSSVAACNTMYLDDLEYESVTCQTADLAAYEDVESPYVAASLTRTPEELNAEADRLLQKISDGLDGSAISPALVEHNTPSLPSGNGNIRKK